MFTAAGNNRYDFIHCLYMSPFACLPGHSSGIKRSIKCAEHTATSNSSKWQDTEVRHRYLRPIAVQKSLTAHKWEEAAVMLLLLLWRLWCTSAVELWGGETHGCEAHMETDGGLKQLWNNLFWYCIKPRFSLPLVRGYSQNVWTCLLWYKRSWASCFSCFCPSSWIVFSGEVAQICICHNP